MSARVYLDHSFTSEVAEALEAQGIDVQRPPERINPTLMKEGEHDFFLYDQFGEAQDQGRAFITRNMEKMQLIEALHRFDDVNPTHNGIIGIETVTGWQMSPQDYASQLDYMLKHYESHDTVLYLDKDGTQRLDLAADGRRFAPIERHLPEPMPYQSSSQSRYTPSSPSHDYDNEQPSRQDRYDPYHEEQQMAMETQQHTPSEMERDADNAYEVTVDSGYEIAD